MSMVVFDAKKLASELGFTLSSAPHILVAPQFLPDLRAYPIIYGLHLRPLVLPLEQRPTKSARKSSN